MNIPAILVAGLVLASPLAYVAYADASDTVAVTATLPTSERAAPTSQKYEGVDHIGVAVGVPYPLCPLECTVGYGFFGDGADDFEVPEGARSIDVIARWTATTPTTRELSVGLYRQDDECGKGCYAGVAGDVGSGDVAFTLEDPEPGLYHVSAHPTGSAYVAAQQDVWFEVTVNL